MTQEKLNEILDALDWERDNLHFIESSPGDEWTERNAKRKRITIQALKRQIPGKLSRIVNEPGILALCQCGEAVQPPEVYCWACGQKLDWSEE